MYFNDDIPASQGQRLYTRMTMQCCQAIIDGTVDQYTKHQWMVDHLPADHMNYSYHKQRT